MFLRKGDCLLCLGRIAEVEALILSNKSKKNLTSPDATAWANLEQKLAEFDESQLTFRQDFDAFYNDHHLFVQQESNKGRFQPQENMQSLSSKVEIRYDPVKGMLSVDDRIDLIEIFLHRIKSTCCH